MPRPEATTRSSKKQRELLTFVDGFIKEHGYGPSYREIMRGLGYKSVSTVAIHINGLITKGFVAKRDNSARSLEVVAFRETQKNLAKSDHEIWLTNKVDDYIGRLKISYQDELFSSTSTLIESLRVLGFSDAYEKLYKKLEIIKQANR